MGDIHSAPTVMVNNEPIAIIPNSCVFDEGFGEQSVRVLSVGGASTEDAYAENVETKKSMIKFSIAPTAFNVKAARGWKSNKNNNVVSLSSKTSDGTTIERIFQKAGLLSSYEIPLAPEGDIELEFNSRPAV